MKSDISKVLHSLAGWSVLRHVLYAASQLKPDRMVLVTSPDADAIAAEAHKYSPDIAHAIQHDAKGTGDAVKAALPHLEGFQGMVLVLYGDSPLTTLDTLQQLTQSAQQHDVVLTTMTPANPAQYGRVLLEDNTPVDIIEYNDANEQQRAISLCNAGIMAVQQHCLADLLGVVDNNNAKQEYYLTDIVALSCQRGLSRSYILAEESEMLGINSRTELAQAEAVMQTRLRQQALSQGVGMVAPETVFLSMDSQFGYDVLLHPYVVLGQVSIGDGVEIRSFCHIDGATIERDATIGPYARIRPGTHLGAESAVGNFVEVKNSHLHDGVKAGHLSYLGDAEIGAGTNIGAGTITCNYDGQAKHRTVIGADAFIGSNSAFVAPVRVGDRVTVGAGSIVTEDAQSDTLVIARNRQVTKAR